MSEPNMYRCTPRQVRQFVTECLYAGLVPFIQSSPGMGKSSIVRSVFEELQLKMIDHRVSTSAPEDFTGLPRFDENGMAHFAPFCELFPIQGMEIPKGYEGWGLFLDEFNSGTKMVQAAGYKLILDRMTGQYPLHDNVVMVLAGNLSTDRAITTALSTAMQSRVVHLEMELNFNEWMEDVALKQEYDQRIIAYLSYKESALMDFRPDHQEKTFCCPRTWEFMNKMIAGRPVTEDRVPLYGGTITSGVAVDFVQFTKVFSTMVQIEDILRDPAKCPVPKDTATCWAVISNMMEKANDKNFDGLAEYADRFDMTFRILFYRSVMIRQAQLKKHPAFAKAMVQLARYLND